MHEPDLDHDDVDGDDEALEVRRILAAAVEPEGDDPAQWSPPEVAGLVLFVAYGVEALQHLGAPGWSDAADLAEDLLFNRDRLQDWLDMMGGEDALEDLMIGDLAEVMLPSEADERLAELYRENSRVREHLHHEYRQFRDDLQPPRHHRWWWLDADLYGQQIH